MSRFLKVSEAFLDLLINGLDEGRDARGSNICDIFKDCGKSGIGASFALSFEHNRKDGALKRGTWCVAAVPRESTAFKAGLHPADAILEVFCIESFLYLFCGERGLIFVLRLMANLARG